MRKGKLLLAGNSSRLIYKDFGTNCSADRNVTNGLEKAVRLRFKARNFGFWPLWRSEIQGNNENFQHPFQGQLNSKREICIFLITIVIWIIFRDQIWSKIFIFEWNNPFWCQLQLVKSSFCLIFKLNGCQIKIFFNWRDAPTALILNDL